MTVDLDEAYLTWLHDQVSPVSVRNPARTFWSFLLQLYQKEFVWFVPNDENRVGDAHTLRQDFLDIYGSDWDEDWLHLGCSMLEMLVALSRRLAFMGGGESRDWFWQMIQNLDIPPCSDLDYRRNPDIAHTIDEVLERVIWRTYDYDGGGGIFPLMHPPKDQRKTELWYQMAAYIIEKEGG